MEKKMENEMETGCRMSITVTGSTFARDLKLNIENLTCLSGISS